MIWEATMLNRLFKSNEFGKVKPRMHRDRIIYVMTDSPKFANILSKVQKDEHVVCEIEILYYFDIDYKELEGIF